MRAWLMFVAVVLAGCSESTGAITPEQQRRLDAEGIVRRADDQMFRYTTGPAPARPDGRTARRPSS